MENMSHSIVPNVLPATAADSKLQDAVETTADISSLVSDQSRIVNEEIEFEDYLRASFSYDKSGRVPVCVNQIIEKIPQDCAVLDAGCGTGNYMGPLVKSGKVKSYIGMDVNEGMLFHARKKAAALRNNDAVHADVTTLAGSLLEDLPFGDNVFDVVVLNQVLPHISDIRVHNKTKYISQMLVEFSRILKPGGVLSINTCTHDQLSAVWYNNAMPEACEMLKFRTPDIDELKVLIESSGFTDFSFTKDTQPLQGNNYWRYDLCFTEGYRSGDAIWSLVRDEEYAKAMMSMKYGLREERDTFDNMSRSAVEKTGHTTQIFCTTV